MGFEQTSTLGSEEGYPRAERTVRFLVVSYLINMIFDRSGTSRFEE